ncbi:hypothetical protein FRB95_010228 [Tulasnella sp. JGI-2019a]|nr:hypothetical protein FRB95_010228 [Tulasnella sp. JGI-2019a]
MHTLSSPSSLIPLLLLVLSLEATFTWAASAADWRTRSIYQVITDRFALPTGSGIDPTACDPSKQQYCGGTWASITANLDYIQNMGFTAIWISPVNQNIPGPTAYGYPYHGYWIADLTQLNDQFGTEQDLINLSDELHKRGMYLMFDIVVNNVASTSLTPDYSQYMLKDASMYHPYCPVDYSNVTSAQQCWLGDTKVPLPDVNTENPDVISAYNTWISDFVIKYKVDGLRIDAAKHVRPSFWGPFCQAAGVFCIGEVFGDPVPYTATYQGPTTLDSVLNFPQYSALTEAFSVSGPRNMSNLVDLFTQARDPQTGFSDPTLLGNFMENQDLPRWSNISVDPQSNWNALTFSFMSDGIPIVYYGQEQRFHGAADPMNREPLWPSGYASTPTMQFIQILNQLRNQLVNASDWATQPAQIISSTNSTIFLAKGYVLSVMTNIGSPPANMSANMVGTGFESGQVMIDVVTCTQVIIGSQGSVNIDYTKGGRAAILLPEYYLRGTTICPAAQALSYQASTDESPSTSGTIVTASPGRPSILISAAFAVLLGALSCLGSA